MGTYMGECQAGFRESEEATNSGLVAETRNHRYRHSPTVAI
jgi:hypothetical protein